MTATAPSETRTNRKGSPCPRIVTFDLMSEDPDYYFLLTTALGDFAAAARAEAEDGGPNAAANTRWAEAAEDALLRIETALATVPEGEGEAVIRTSPRSDPHTGAACPPWCVADHSAPFADACVGRPAAAGNAWACPVLRADGRLYVSVNGIGAGLDLSPDGAGQLAAVLGLAGDTSGLAAAIRQAAAVATA